MILFVEEQEASADLYYDEMKRKSLPVHLFLSVDDAWQFLSEKAAPLDVAILDVMMPPGRLLQDVDTSDGLNTGLRFYELLRRHYPAVPVFLLTNLTTPIVGETIKADPNAWIRIKSDTFYDEFAEEIEAA